MIEDMPSIAYTARQRIYSIANKFVFITTFSIGAIGIIFLKSYGVRQLYVTLFPVTCMIAYLLFILSFSKYSTSEERAGDSLYYLGLLYTLVSLACVLYQFTYHATTAEIFVQNFGIALSTTILGLAARVVLMHLHPDNLISEQTARQAYIRALQVLRDELTSVVVDMQTFRRSVMQSTSEATLELSEHIRKSLLENVENFSLSLSAVLKGLDTAINTHFKSFEEIAADSGLKLSQMITGFKDNLGKALTEVVASVESSRDTTKQLNRSAKNVVAAAEKLFGKISEIEAPSDVLTKKLDEVLTGLSEGAKSNLTINKEIAGTHQQLVKGLTEAVSTLENLGAHLAVLTAAGPDFQKLSSAVSETSTLLSSFTDTIKAHSAQLARLPDEFKQDIAVVSRLRIDLEKEVAKSRQAISTIQSSLSQLVSVIVEKLKND
jgi:chromosome segregation ATPase